MGGTYAGSLVTIAASSSPSSVAGCYNLSPSSFEEFKRLLHLVSKLSDDRESALYVFRDWISCQQDPRHLYYREVLTGPLSKRV